MPFTISHAAAVLPLQKTRLPLAALMIGSMSPDFAYFLPGEPLREDTHSIAGIFWFCWPVSVALWFLFVGVLEQPTLALLPDRWHARFAPSDRKISVKTLAFASAAVIAGRSYARSLGLVYASGHRGRRGSPRPARGGFSYRRLANSLVRGTAALELSLRTSDAPDLGVAGSHRFTASRERFRRPRMRRVYGLSPFSSRCRSPSRSRATYSTPTRGSCDGYFIS